MHPLNIYYLIRPSTVIILDPRGVNWEAWLAQIRTDAILSDVWQYIDPAIPDQQIPPLNPPEPVPAEGFVTREGEGQANSNNYRVASEWAVARSIANDRVREWRLYDDKLYALRVIKAFILWTAPIAWFTYQGVIGGGPFGNVRNLLAFLGARVRAIRNQVASLQRQQQQQQMFPGGDGGDGGGNAASQGYVMPSERIWQ